MHLSMAHDPDGGAPPRTRDDSGFTLLELLIIMVILGVLAAIAVFAVGGMDQATAVAACRADFKTVETAQGAYESQKGQPGHLGRPAGRRVAQGAAGDRPTATRSVSTLPPGTSPSSRPIRLTPPQTGNANCAFA